MKPEKIQASTAFEPVTFAIPLKFSLKQFSSNIARECSQFRGYPVFALKVLPTTLFNNLTKTRICLRY